MIDVHEVTEEADFFFERMTGMEIPGSQREQYEYLYLGMLETIQVMAFGSDRVLAAALLVGPGGRSLAIMPPEERDRFLTLVRSPGSISGTRRTWSSASWRTWATPSPRWVSSGDPRPGFVPLDRILSCEVESCSVR